MVTRFGLPTRLRPPMRLGPIVYRPQGRGQRGSHSGAACVAGGPTLTRGQLRCCISGGSSPSGSGAGSSHGASPSLSEDLLRLFEETSLFDVEVVCTSGAGQKFRAHRVILAARSPVFKAMFLTGMREKRIGKVVIEDVSPESTKCMLDFMYKDKCPDLDEASVFDVLKAANKYELPGLRDLCLHFMSCHARSDNVVHFVAACDRYGLPDFKHALLGALVDHPPALHECVHSSCLDAHPDTMRQLLSLCAHRLAHTFSTEERRGAAGEPVGAGAGTGAVGVGGSRKCRYGSNGGPFLFDGIPFRSRCSLCVREVALMSKQALGEALFPMVQSLRPEHANKITGMIIELDRLELVPLFESESVLQEKVEEAVAVLRAAEAEDLAVAAAAVQQTVPAADAAPATHGGDAGPSAGSVSAASSSPPPSP